MFALGRDTEARLHDLFDPIGQKLVEDYAAIRRGGSPPTTRRHAEIY